MLDWPIVSVLIVTYDRPLEIRRTIFALCKHLYYPQDRLRFHLSDDASPPLREAVNNCPAGTPYVDYIRQQFPCLSFSHTTTDRAGWGANVNAGMRYCLQHSDYVFLCEDDYVALRDLDLEAGVALLESTEDLHKPGPAPAREPIGLVRFDGIAAHWLNLQLREADTRIGAVSYLKIGLDSPFLNAYSHRPHLKHKRFHEAYGYYPEGLRLGETESAFAHAVKGKASGPWLVTLGDGIERAFEHIGKSRQGTEYDKGG